MGFTDEMLPKDDNLGLDDHTLDKMLFSALVPGNKNNDNELKDLVDQMLNSPILKESLIEEFCKRKGLSKDISESDLIVEVMKSIDTELQKYHEYHDYACAQKGYDLSKLSYHERRALAFDLDPETATDFDIECVSRGIDPKTANPHILRFIYLKVDPDQPDAIKKLFEAECKYCNIDPELPGAIFELNQYASVIVDHYVKFTCEELGLDPKDPEILKAENKHYERMLGPPFSFEYEE